ncbi:MAG: MBL fold metallo-hydrolase [Candidatus Krumholzibacteria bacterium]|jgi:beta-lactamase superfamily II metal-dependent hydrolase|nr:MBL fold metallo-hydrolase [Candidatus Krumholzibacteria bacterium]
MLMRSLTCLALATLLLPAVAPAGVTITVLDVGQGDATLVRSTSGTTLLFDAGPSGSHTAILSYLASQGITALDYIVSSHYHADHIGGTVAVYQQTGATSGVWDRGWSYTTATYQNYAAAVAADRQTLTAGQVLDLGAGVTATVLALNGNGVLSPPFSNANRENEYSVALLIECGSFDYFQAGDITGVNDGSYVDIETSVAQTMSALGKANLEIYKVNHHGSYSSSNAYFLNTTTPEVAIISCGVDNSYGHPHAETLTRLQQRDIFVYMTTAGGGATLPPSEMTIVGGHVVIETTGYLTYTVNGDLWEMDEQGTGAWDSMPVLFALHGNHPNPFNPATVISFTSLRGGDGRLEIYDLAGRRQSSSTFSAPAGPYELTWHARDAAGRALPAGVYLYQIVLPDGRDTGRMVLAK